MAKKFAKSFKSKDMKGLLQKLIFIIIGNFLCSIAFNVFFIPNKLLSGGVGGLAIIIQYLTTLPAGISVFLINIPIFVIGTKMIDREFAIYGFISMLVLSFLLTITNGIGEYFIIDDILLASVFGGVFNGIGMGLMFRNRVSQGGFDIIAAILRIKYNVNIGSGLMAVNTVIISLSSLLFGYKSAMYTLIGMYIGYRILDKVQTGFNVKKNIIIVSEKSEEVANAIITKLHRGVTFLEGMGGYTNEDKKVIYCIVTSRETATLKNIVEEIDPSAFFTINDVVEVQGSGFKNVGM
ncbi:YitT family protein [Schnuerera sp.]|uniref:YitT family protein n=1 Tax=Schnuerera sp. TaxID=2794844 RepID=UPI002BBF084D|nr:YitT family protein [Schnuerera sp.]HSH36719.1 YitT family protein [Schnuerera sp.]